MSSGKTFELIVLDLDGTLYDINDVIANVYRCQIDFLITKLNKPASEIGKFLAENHVFPFVSKKSKSATELFHKLGISKTEWTDYRNRHFDVKTIRSCNAVEENILRQLADISTLVLLSSNTFLIIENILSHLGYSKELFDCIVCSDRYPIAGSFNKYDAMRFISDNYSVKPQAMLSIGDRFNTDIKPMLQLGGAGALLYSPKSMNMVLLDLREGKLHSCKEYDFYDIISE